MKVNHLVFFVNRYTKISCTAQMVKILKTVTKPSPPESGASKCSSSESFYLHFNHL